MSAIEFQQAIDAGKPLATTNEITVTVADDAVGMEAARQTWIALQDHPNSDLDVYTNTIRSLPGVLGPYVLIAWRGTVPEGLLIGRLEDRIIDCKFGYRSIIRPKRRILSFIYGGLLGSPDSDVCRALAGAIRDALRNGVADAAFFNHLGQSTPLYKAMMEQSSATTRDPAPLIQTHRRMVLPTSAEAFWAGLSSKVRKNQRWQLKKLLSDLGDGVQICCFSRAEEVEHMSIDVEGIAKTTYQRGLNAGFVDSPDMRSRLALRAAKGWLRGYVLYIGGEPQAFWLGTLYRGTFHSDYMGYAARYAKYSPGMCLVMRVIEELCSTTSGVESIDFGLGDAQYKQILGNRESQDVSVYFFASNMRGLTLNALRTPIIVADRMARGVLEKGKWVSGVKRFWRRSKADAAVRQTNQ